MKNLFDVRVDNFDEASGVFSYTVYNITEQKLGFDFVFNGNVQNYYLSIKPKEMYISQIYDID